MLTALALLCAPLVQPGAELAPAGARAGEPGGPPLALRCAKALVCARDGAQVVDRALVIVRDGKIESVGPARELRVPEGAEEFDAGERWLMPGMIDLHTHVGGSIRDLGDVVYLVNPELRASATVTPNNPYLQRALAGGVTVQLLIPGSGSNCGGQGILLKTAPTHYDDAVIANPGSLKVAQWGNPENWTVGVGKTFEGYAIRNMFLRGRDYAAAWRRFEAGEGTAPERNLSLDVFRAVYDHHLPISVHTQIYQVVLLTITMLKGELGVNVFCDHSEIGGWMAAPVAQKLGVPAIVGPRSVDPPSRQFINWAESREEGFLGLGAGWQKLGHQMIGFNTDCVGFFTPPAEELSLQAGMAGHYGMDGSRLELVRGLTIVPAITAGIDARVGSLEPGKDADILLIRGDPADPRSGIDRVWIEGRVAYDAERDGRSF